MLNEVGFALLYARWYDDWLDIVTECDTIVVQTFVFVSLKMIMMVNYELSFLLTFSLNY